ncbi:hypothetical protein JCGZ_03601 [Jatropha curcas]|uniref:Uncharacterized protein n=1 Tax=Jatropha curcas TaxID=180498 RepID=A0A067JQD8_JATCU|nr:hypothetical protein JCGZ_03601 [Jatropha curcas]
MESFETLLEASRRWNCLISPESVAAPLRESGSSTRVAGAPIATRKSWICVQRRKGDRRRLTPVDLSPEGEGMERNACHCSKEKEKKEKRRKERRSLELLDHSGLIRTGLV